jgi:hypothetical protein
MEILMPRVPSEIISRKFSMSVNREEVVHIPSEREQEPVIKADEAAVSVQKDSEASDIRITLLPPESPGFISRVLSALHIK